MAPIKPKKSFGTKSSDSKSKDSSSSKPSSSKAKTPAKSNALSKRPVKTKRPTIAPKKKPRVYTDKELALPTLNMITPAGVTKPKGKKKGKIFVDDAESMRTILAMVSADREGQIESKMQKARQMEEIREARRAEQEKKDAQRKEKLEEVKDGLRKKRRKVGKENEEKIMLEQEERDSSRKGKKRVSFG